MFVCVLYVFLSLCFICLALSFHPSFLFLSRRIKHVYQLSLHLASSSQHATQLIESFNNRYSSGSVCACNCDCVMCVYVGGGKGGVVCKHDDALGCSQCTCQICLLIFDACTYTLKYTDGSWQCLVAPCVGHGWGPLLLYHWQLVCVCACVHVCLCALVCVTKQW